jgi:hypothetical protein
MSISGTSGTMLGICPLRHPKNGLRKGLAHMIPGMATHRHLS